MESFHARVEVESKPLSSVFAEFGDKVDGSDSVFAVRLPVDGSIVEKTRDFFEGLFVVYTIETIRDESREFVDVACFNAELVEFLFNGVESGSSDPITVYESTVYGVEDEVESRVVSH